MELDVKGLHYPNKPIELKLEYKNLQVLSDYPMLKICKIENADTIPVKEIPMKYKTKKTYVAEDTVYILNEGLDVGEYIIVSDSIAPNDRETPYYSGYNRKQTFTVSRLASFNRNHELSGYEVYVVDNLSGQPIKGAEVEVYGKVYDKPEEKVSLRTLETDENGLAEFRSIPEVNQEYRQYNLRYSVSLGKDKAKNDEYLNRNWNLNSSQSKDDEDDEDWTISIFTDRHIYRPGQTVYFKAILLKQDSALATNKNVEVDLVNANRETIDTKELKTNEFGSVSGEFILPKLGLLGDYTIYVEGSEYTIKVEEYKRPTFEITFDKVKESYAFDQKVKVKGNVKNYSGIPLIGVDISYTISANNFSSWRYNPDENILISDTIRTTDDGAFEITFNPTENDVSDDDWSSRKVYQYTINAVATDLNGETQEGTFTFGVGQVSMMIEFGINEKVNKEDTTIYNITAKNLNGEQIETTGRYTLYKLNSDKDSTKILDGVFKTGKQADLCKQIKKQKSGKYKLEIRALDSNDVEITENSHFILFSYKDKKPPIETNDWLLVKQNFVGNKSAEFILGVSDKDVRMLYLLYNENKIFSKEYLTLSNENKLFKIPYREEYGDEITCTFVYVKNGEFYKKNISLIKEKDRNANNLFVKLETFRDKLRPGQEETWTLSVKDSKNNFAITEILASMYDQSLDQIYEGRDWSFQYPYERKNIYTIDYSYSNKYSSSYTPKLLLKYPSLYLLSQNRFFGWGVDSFNWFGLIYQPISGWYNNVVYKGRVLGKRGEPLTKAVIIYAQKSNTYPYLKERDNEIFVNENGEFEFVGKEDLSVTVGCEGFYSQQIDIWKQSGAPITIYLIENTNFNSELEEFVITSTGTQKKISVTASISNVSVADVVPSIVARDEFGEPGSNFSDFWIRGISSFGVNDKALVFLDGVEVSAEDIDASEVESFSVLKDASATAVYGSRGANGVLLITTKKAAEQQSKEVQVRKNFNETAFFYPQLRTDEKGEVKISFTVPESNTTWKFRALAHDKKSRAGQLMQTVISRKELMVTPNMPRFLREGDRTSISAKISNMSDKMFAGDVYVEFFNPIDDKPIDIAVDNSRQPFAVGPNQSVVAEWTFDVPRGMDFIGCRIVAGNASSSDGEQHSLVILPSKVLVTESMPIDVMKEGETIHSFDRMKEHKSTTLENYKLTFEFTSNPSWFAIQSLPVISNPQNENAVNWFAAYYVNTLGGSLMKQYPQVAAMIEAWKAQGGDKDTFVSKLQQNEDLKNILLSETPWVMEANSETEQMNRLSLLFDMNTNAQKIKDASRKLSELQDVKWGGWTWFKGMYPSRSITQYILYGYASLQRVAMVEYPEEVKMMQMSALRYIDEGIVSDYKALKRNNKDWEKQTRIYTNQLEYMYVRSFYRDIPINPEIREAERFYTKVASDNWTKLDLYECSLLAVVLKRNGDTALANKIVKSIKERSVTKDKMGMYWPNNKSHVFFSMSTVSVHVFLMEALKENGATEEELDLMKQWLVKQKQTQMWESTHATIDAIYALLSMGNNNLSVEASSVEAKVGDVSVAFNDGMKGTGYIKTSWSGSDITSDKAVVTISKADKQLSYGALYWQYFEEADKIERSTSADLQIDKKVLKEVQDGTEKKLVLITDEKPLSVGDKVVMRLTIQVANDLEFVHVKDMRAPCFEPAQALSGVKWMDGACYYQETKDASTNFFFDRLPKGTYVLEYPVYVNRTGTYSNGITTIQSVYAPELRSHTGGEVISVP